MTHPQTYALATLLNRVDTTQYETVAECLEELFADWPDAKKADLYALLAEHVNPRSTVVNLIDDVSYCLTKNMQRFA